MKTKFNDQNVRVTREWDDPLEGVIFHLENSTWKILKPLFNQPYDEVYVERIEPTYGIIFRTNFKRSIILNKE